MQPKAGGASVPARLTPTLVCLPIALFYIWEREKNHQEPWRARYFRPFAFCKARITSEITDPYTQDNEWACHSFKDLAEDMRLPGQRQKAFLFTLSRQHGWLCQSSEGQPGGSNLGNPAFYNRLWASLSHLYPEQRRYLSTAQQTDLHCALEGGTISTFPGCLQRYPGEDTAEQAVSASACNPCRTTSNKNHLFCLSDCYFQSTSLATEWKSSPVLPGAAPPCHLPLHRTDRWTRECVLDSRRAANSTWLTLEPRCLGSDPDSTVHLLCDLSKLLNHSVLGVLI